MPLIASCAKEFILEAAPKDECLNYLDSRFIPSERKSLAERRVYLEGLCTTDIISSFLTGLCKSIAECLAVIIWFFCLN